jgi:hypothetical protein
MQVPLKTGFTVVVIIIRSISSKSEVEVCWKVEKVYVAG